ncbi:MAG: hypothetical protein IJI22_02370 [Bacilli bacterium]|nr:hypothetical protein [Bacilli bacterium]
MKETYKSRLLLVTLIIILLLYLINAQFIITCIINYSKLFLTKLFPVSFVFFIISNLLIDYGLIEFLSTYLRINISRFYIFFISMISGFPSGAKYIVDLYNKGLIDIETANKSIMFSHFPNPLFVLGSVNMILHDYLLSLKLLFSILISNFIIYLVTKNKTGAATFTYSAPESFSYCLIKAINDSSQVMFLIYGISLFFYLISAIITKYVKSSPLIYILVSGMFDLTQGVFSTIVVSNNTIRALCILIFISFGSLTIHMQVNGIINNTGIKYRNFLRGRLLGLFLSICIFLILVLL